MHAEEGKFAAEFLGLRAVVAVPRRFRAGGFTHHRLRSHRNPYPRSVAHSVLSIDEIAPVHRHPDEIAGACQPIPHVLSEIWIEAFNSSPRVGEELLKALRIGPGSYDLNQLIRRGRTKAAKARRDSRLPSSRSAFYQTTR
jgi:hypothetical protein